ncbi:MULTISPECIES: isocitrate lyase/phosphoenolpyruvate mutase family protein [Streptomyces]|uniref:Phosphoenolpyruvate mutase n=2 Tax=Streptomyces TaxID=1883 RepID=V5QNB0_9ACTN|nr:MULTISPECIES: isocitrate lyase/phosphoenolpyruvate mutase family protein [Streptomyces]AHB17934.1 phosphoenolpyruvate mutase [Streptomyces regensis]KMS87994.1 phosphoenolpyruvate phosphomutase [Streptomyces regensis]KOG62558.1 phosphoenolpyruvate phosphomutase [Streptomyces antibioticus]MBG7702833.1 isocitrate lyase/phosphoenolpyruvate mutase family protein [Streptomyces sp. MC1]
MQRPIYPSFRSVLADNDVVRVAGANHALGGLLAEEAGFQAVWSSSLEVSASRGLPDASILSMTEYLEAAANIQKVLRIPVVADCDTGYGGNLNVAHMVHEFEAAGITGLCIEDKLFPKMNSFVAGGQTLLGTKEFAKKIKIAKEAQASTETFVIARTEALISGLDVDAALERCRTYADSGADAVLVHSKAKTRDQVVAFLEGWDFRVPVVIVPTTYPDWHIEDIRKAGVSVVIYANHGLRATVSALRDTYRSVYENGDTTALEGSIASVKDIFALQGLDTWQKLDS